MYILFTENHLLTSLPKSIKKREQSRSIRGMHIYILFTQNHLLHLSKKAPKRWSKAVQNIRTANLKFGIQYHV